MFKYLQNIGKALMMPVAVLPAAGLMLGIGYAIDPAGWGGKSNLVSIDNCATRLRLEVRNSDLVQTDKIKKIAAGVVKPSKTSVQIIIGPKVKFVCNELKKLI